MALAEAERAIAEPGAEPKLRAEGHGLRALCLTRLGRGKSEEAAKSVAEVDAFLATIPPVMAEPARLQLEGELALARGDHEQARVALEKAAALLPPKAVSMDSAPVEIQFALARAALAAGGEKDAREALASVVEAGPRRVVTPIPYVRSLALLAALEEKQGRAERGARALRALPELLEARRDRPRRGGPGRPAPRGAAHAAGGLKPLARLHERSGTRAASAIDSLDVREPPPPGPPKRRLLPWIALAVVWIVWGSTYLGDPRRGARDAAALHGLLPLPVRGRC